MCRLYRFKERMLGLSTSVNTVKNRQQIGKAEWCTVVDVCSTEMSSLTSNMWLRVRILFTIKYEIGIWWKRKAVYLGGDYGIQHILHQQDNILFNKWQFPLIRPRIYGFLAIHIEYRRAGCHWMQNFMKIDTYFLGINFSFKIVICS